MSDGNPDLQRGSAEPATSRSLPEWLVVIGVGLFAALVFAIPFWNNAFFYYVGDNPESFVPDWYHFGELLRAGQLPFMDAAGWYGGNYPGEAAYSLWHPVLLLDFVVVSLFDDLAMAAAVVMVEHLALLAMGVFLLAREYGSGRAAAVVVAIGVPATGFTLYYEASGWPAGLAAFTWVTWFWWGARRCSRRLASPLVPFGLGLLAIATGSPYAVLGVLIVLFGIAVELVVRRDFKVLTHLIVTGGCVAAASTLVFLPLLGSLPVTQRQDLAMLANDTFMVPDVGDLAASGSPTYLPSILNWNGAVLERVPSTYFIWFVIPLLPWLHWRGLRSDFRRLASLAIVTGSYGVLVLGPSNVWLFRWPIRLIEYLYLGLGVLFALLLSSGLARDRFRQRAFTSAALVAGGCYLSFAGRPELWRMHVAVAAAVLVLTLGAIVLYLRGSWLAFIGVLLVGTIGVVAYQTSRIPARPPENEAVTPARYVSAIKDRSAAYRGPVLQLADRAAGPAEDETKILLGNLSVVTGHESLNRYSGISFAKFNAALCMDYKGLVCPDSYDRLWRSYPGTDVPLIDALRVQTLVLQNRLLPQVVDGPPAQGWTLALRDETRTIWVRSEPLSLPGRVSWASAGTEVRSANAGPRSERVTFRAPEQGGRLVFARLAWPGHSARVDGQRVQVENGAAGLINIAVPPGEHVLELGYETPGLRVGIWILVTAIGMAFAQAVLWWISGRRDRRRVSHNPDRENSASEKTPTPVASRGPRQSQVYIQPVCAKSLIVTLGYPMAHPDRMATGWWRRVGVLSVVAGGGRVGSRHDRRW